MMGIIIQARLGSTRLPRKALAMIDGHTMLAHVVFRSCRISPLGMRALTIVAVPQNDLPEIAQGSGVPGLARWVGGPPNDVLRRYVRAAHECNVDPIVRLTADCPLIDPEACRRVIDVFDPAAGIHYASNIRPETDGLDCEIFSRALLDTAAEQAETPYDREHVTPWMRRNTRTAFVREPDLPRKTSVDTAEDLAYVRELVAAQATLAALA